MRNQGLFHIRRLQSSQGLTLMTLTGRLWGWNSLMCSRPKGITLVASVVSPLCLSSREVMAWPNVFNNKEESSHPSLTPDYPQKLSFSEFCLSPRKIMCASMPSWCLATMSHKWATIIQSFIYSSTQMPWRCKGARTAFKHIVQVCDNTVRAKGRTRYWYTSPPKANLGILLCSGWMLMWNYVSFTSIVTKQSLDLKHYELVHQHLELQSTIQSTQI